MAQTLPPLGPRPAASSLPQPPAAPAGPSVGAPQPAVPRAATGSAAAPRWAGALPEGQWHEFAHPHGAFHVFTPGGSRKVVAGPAAVVGADVGALRALHSQTPGSSYRAHPVGVMPAGAFAHPTASYAPQTPALGQGTLTQGYHQTLGPGTTTPPSAGGSAGGGPVQGTPSVPVPTAPPPDPYAGLSPFDMRRGLSPRDLAALQRGPGAGGPGPPSAAASMPGGQGQGPAAGPSAPGPGGRLDLPALRARLTQHHQALDAFHEQAARVGRHNLPEEAHQRADQAQLGIYKIKDQLYQHALAHASSPGEEYALHLTHNMGSSWPFLAHMTQHAMPDGTVRRDVLAPQDQALVFQARDDVARRSRRQNEIAHQQGWDRQDAAQLKAATDPYMGRAARLLAGHQAPTQP